MRLVRVSSLQVLKDTINVRTLVALNMVVNLKIFIVIGLLLKIRGLMDLELERRELDLLRYLNGICLAIILAFGQSRAHS